MHDDDDDSLFLDASDDFPFLDASEEFPSNFHNSTLSPHPTLRRRKSVKTKQFLHHLATIQDEEKAETEGEGQGETSVVTNEERRDYSFSAAESEANDGQSSILVIMAELVVKAIGFQLNLLGNFLKFPFKVFYYSFMFAVNPFGSFLLLKSYLFGKVMGMWKSVGNLVCPYLMDWVKEHRGVFDVVWRCGWGLFWSVYVCSVLVTFLIAAFLVSGVIMRCCLVEEPFRLKQQLNYDYSKSKPVALVPVMSCASVVECGEKSEGGSFVGGGVRVVPYNHKLLATVSLVLPESDYNRNLGMFQVRVEFLSENGKSLGSLSHPCMLEFRSEPIRMLLTMFKIVPLVAGYVSETQILKLKFRGYRESVNPTACIKVSIEQRAEFQSGAGIPEIYDAFLYIESELPFFKRLLWYWRRTIFVWLAILMFLVELLFALACCRPVLMPRARSRSNNASSNRARHQTSNSSQR